MPSDLPQVRQPTRLRAELLWAILIKLALVLCIKFMFFNQPVSKPARAQAVEAMLITPKPTQGGTQVPGSPPDKDSQHDQRATR
jgi:hypothetical protein